MNQPDPTETDAAREARLRETYGGNWPVQNSVHFLLRLLDEARAVVPAPTADRRDRWRYAARDIARRGWADEVRCAPLDDGEFEQDATDLMAVADAEQAELRAAVLGEAADIIERAQHERDDLVNTALGFLDNNTEQQHVGVHRAAQLLRRLAAVPAVEEQPENETPDTPPREPHPTEADQRHALTLLARVQGRDAAGPAEYRHTCHDQKSAPGRDYDCQWCSTLPDSLPAKEADRG